MRVALGSPIYERAEPAFVTCLIDALDTLRERGHEADWRYASTIVHYARNYLMKDMLDCGADVLVQLDADNQWDPSDLCDAVDAVAEGCADVVGFAYLDRKQSHIRDVRWASPIVHGPLRPGFERAGKRYIEVDAVGGGALVCSRASVERMSADAPRQPLGDAPVLFDFRVEVGEDRFFCERWRAMGGRVHCDATSLVGHIGSTVYALNPAHLLMELGERGA